jgi:glucoamylase
MFLRMMLNVASSRNVFHDPSGAGESIPGCIVASPYSPPNVVMSYLFNWVRDSAIVAMEIAAAATNAEDAQALNDYVNFAALCQSNAQPTLGHSCFTIDGMPRPWTEQNDGPALQTLAILAAFPHLDPQSELTARAVIQRNVEYLLSVYQYPTTNIWEESTGDSFFARAVQLRCFQAMVSNPYGLPVPAGLPEAVAWLEKMLESHWNGTYYSTLIPTGAERGYDPNMDIVMASVYGAASHTDPRLLATAALLRRAWTDLSSPECYPINQTDEVRGLGPLLGRYPGDRYSLEDPGIAGHPWSHCTCNFAELYYRLANEIAAGQSVPLDRMSIDFFLQIGVSLQSSPAETVTLLRDAGDRMLQSVAFHSDNLRLGEQFDAVSGYVRGPPDLAWAYAAFLSATRARASAQSMAA